MDELVGFWDLAVPVGAEEPAGAFKILFMSTGEFAFIEVNSSEPPNGVELGTYEVLDDILSFDFEFDGIGSVNWGDGGLSDADGPAYVREISENYLKLDIGSYEDILLEKTQVQDTSNFYHDLWRLDYATYGDEMQVRGDAFVLLLPNNQFYVLDPELDPVQDIYDGLEYGEYTYDSLSEVFNFNFLYDGTRYSVLQDSGLSNRGDLFVQEKIDDNTFVAQFNSNPLIKIQFSRVEQEATLSRESFQSEQHSLTVIANVFGSIMFLDGLTETVTSDSHTIEYNGTTFDYEEVDAIITTVVRDDEFTEEFSAEIVESFPEFEGISYNTALALIGQPNMEGTLLMVAGFDGNYVG